MLPNHIPAFTIRSDEIQQSRNHWPDGRRPAIASRGEGRHDFQGEIVVNKESRHVFPLATTTPARNARRPARTSRTLRRVLYAQQWQDACHAFPDWGGRAAHVPPGLIGG